MARKKSPKGQNPIVAEILTAGPRTKPQQPAVSVGVKSESKAAAVGGMLVSASSAGESSKLFPRGGDAFAAFCQARGINTNQKRKAEEWSQLLEEFANRPVHGCRRGPDGGNHRPSPESLG